MKHLLRDPLRRRRTTTSGVAVSFFSICSILLAATHVAAREPDSAQRPVDFQRDIQPLLAARCHSCHGAKKQEGGLRLDIKAGALQGGDGGKVIEPGRPGESELLYRVSSSEPEEVMPPEGERLSKPQVALLERWIRTGADWPADGVAATRRSDHWAFQPVRRGKPPEVINQDWVRNPLDNFVLARLEREGIAPSVPADRYTLIRRLYLDLTGLPPSPVEIDQFVADADPLAYEKLVQRLLDAPHFGERWAIPWLDLARYADSDGYEKDLPRPHAYHWRDWVIDAINRDLPFDQFTVQQLAGDLLPGATNQTRLATGFHRNSLTNREGGIDQEEFRVKAVVDRLNTTFTAWMGLTVGCAECHSHKYDPITQREYYGLFAFFNDADEQDIPLDPAPQQLAAHREALATHDRRLQELQGKLDAAADAVRQRLPVLEKQWLARQQPGEAGEAPGELVLHLPLDQPDADGLREAISGTTLGSFYGKGGPQTAEGKQGGSLHLAGSGHFRLGDAFVFRRERPFSYGAWIFSEGGGAVITKMDDDDAYRGIDLLATGRRVQVHLIHTWSSNAIKVETVDQLPQKQWTHLLVTYDGSSKAAGVKLYVDGKPRRLKVHVDSLSGTLVTKQPLRIGARSQSGSFRGRIDDVRIYDRALGAAEAEAVANDDVVRRIVGIPAKQRSPAQKSLLSDFFVGRDAEAAKLRRQLDALRSKAPKQPAGTAHVMIQRGSPRKTHVHLRGDFLQKGDEVQVSTPAFLPALDHRGTRPDRLDLARWVVAPDNPLTPRVAVNHIWAQLFGQGLVKTNEDFGTQGEPPTHPQLLDWLASEWPRLNWSRKRLIQLIVNSNTYRQSSALRSELQQRDPQNRLLARQSRFRLSGELIRDQYLAASDLLQRRVGGASFRPELPPGVTQIQFVNQWKADSADAVLRRGMYIHLQRNLMLPMLMTFDRPDAIITCTRRERSNTPLQALTLLNGSVFVQSARALGRRLATHEETHLEARIRQAYLRCVCREPDEFESRRVRRLYEELHELYSQDAAAAAHLLGENPPEGVAASEVATWVAIARTLLNLDEVITRE